MKKVFELVGGTLVLSSAEEAKNASPRDGREKHYCVKRDKNGRVFVEATDKRFALRVWESYVRVLMGIC